MLDSSISRHAGQLHCRAAHKLPALCLLIRTHAGVLFHAAVLHTAAADSSSVPPPSSVAAQAWARSSFAACWSRSV